jgi:oligopeptide transport system permease protein
MSVNIIIGVVYGAISGYYGGLVDLGMQRFIEVLNGIPFLVVIILFVLYYGPGIIPIAMALCLTGWIGMSRMIRAQFYKYKGMEYVLASRTLGATDRTLIFRHILPNAFGIIITMSALAIPGAIFQESFLAYIGLGIQAPEPSIGVLLAEGQLVLLEYPHLTIFPALVISILMISFNLLGNGLRDAFDPTLRGQE